MKKAGRASKAILAVAVPVALGAPALEGCVHPVYLGVACAETPGRVPANEDATSVTQASPKETPVPTGRHEPGRAR